MAQELARLLTQAHSLREFLLDRVRKHAGSLARDLNRVAQAQTVADVANVSVSNQEWTQLLVDRARLEELQERIDALEWLVLVSQAADQQSKKLVEM